MKPAKPITMIAAIVVIAGSAAACLAENWPQFRGPTGLGYTQEKNLPTTWGGPDNKNILWKAPLTGQGHASPIVWEDSVFTCTVQWPATVADRKKVIPDHHLACYHAVTGKLLWDKLIPPGPWLRTDFRSGPSGGYAAATPVTDGLVYFDSGREGPGVAVDPTGAGDVSETHIRWTGQYIPEALSSPTIVGDHIYRLFRPDRLECRELKTGKLIYTEKMPGISTAWASPIADPQGRLFFANAGKSYIIQTGPKFKILAANDLPEGNHPSPAAANGKIFLAGTKNIYCISQ